MNRKISRIGLTVYVNKVVLSDRDDETRDYEGKNLSTGRRSRWKG